MADPITIAAMGSRGVNVDTNPLLLDDSELRSAQNLYHNPSDAQAGGLRTRKGFASFIAAPFTGPVLGGLGLAVAGVALATGAGGGLGTGENVGTTNNGSAAGGGPGSELVPGGSGGGGSIPGAFAPSGALFGGARIVVIGRQTTTGSALGDSWYVTSENLADTARITTSPGPPNTNPTMRANGVLRNHAMPFSAQYNEWFLYPSGRSGSGDANFATLQTIRKTNGTTDELVVTIPNNTFLITGAGKEHTVYTMLTAYNTVWFTETSMTAATGTHFGRLMRLNPDTDQFFDCNLGASGSVMAASTFIPYCLAGFLGQAWMGTWGEVSTVLGTSGAQILAFTDTSLDGGSGGSGSGYVTPDVRFALPHCGIGSMLTYKGVLYASTVCIQSGANKAFAYIAARDTAAVGLGTWTTSFTASGAGATPNDDNFFPSMAEFSGNLYASYINGNANSAATGAIFKFDGTTWTRVYAATGTSNKRAYHLRVDDQTLYAIGAGTISIQRGFYLTTADGTTWATGAMSGALTGSVNNTTFPLLFGFEQ